MIFSIVDIMGICSSHNNTQIRPYSPSLGIIRPVINNIKNDRNANGISESLNASHLTESLNASHLTGTLSFRSTTIKSDDNKLLDSNRDSVITTASNSATCSFRNNEQKSVRAIFNLTPSPIHHALPSVSPFPPNVGEIKTSTPVFIPPSIAKLLNESSPPIPLPGIQQDLPNSIPLNQQISIVNEMDEKKTHCLKSYENKTHRRHVTAIMDENTIIHANSEPLSPKSPRRYFMENIFPFQSKIDVNYHAKVENKSALMKPIPVRLSRKRKYGQNKFSDLKLNIPKLDLGSITPEVCCSPDIQRPMSADNNFSTTREIIKHAFVPISMPKSVPRHVSLLQQLDELVLY